MRAFWVLLAIAAACKMNEKQPQPPPAPAPQVAPRSRYCADAKEWPAGTKTCSDDHACGSGERCYADGIPDYSGMCGAVPPDMIRCHEDRDCKHGERCETDVGPCGSHVASCVAGCTPTSCGAGQRCNKKLRCEAIPCSEGFECGSGTQCGSGFYKDEHGCGTRGCWEGGADCGPIDVCRPNAGCSPLECKHSTDCPCGGCVDGMCRARPGVCGPENIPMPG